MTSRSDLILTERQAVRAIEHYHRTVAVGEVIRRLRRITGLSQHAVAVGAGLSDSTFRRVEHGARGLRPDERERVAVALSSGLLSEPELSLGSEEVVA
jgi:transcriptional regulator with XRE-family HTH domain